MTLTEAERVRGDIVTAVKARLRRYGLERERSASASPAARTAVRGLHRGYRHSRLIPGFSCLYVGGDFAGTRLDTPVADRVPLDAIAEMLDPLFELLASSRIAGEGWRFCHRAGLPAMQQALPRAAQLIMSHKWL